MSTFFKENTLEDRRNLRGKIEKRSLAINEDFLTAFKGVKNVLDDMHRDVVGMSDCVQSMTSRLQTTKSRTMQLIEQAQRLQGERYYWNGYYQILMISD